VMLQSPLDISRPLWTVTVVEGVENGQVAAHEPRRHRWRRRGRDVRPHLRFGA
jgi:hypothetical protein